MHSVEFPSFPFSSSFPIPQNRIIKCSRSCYQFPGQCYVHCEAIVWRESSFPWVAQKTFHSFLGNNRPCPFKTKRQEELGHQLWESWSTRFPETGLKPSYLNHVFFLQNYGPLGIQVISSIFALIYFSQLWLLSPIPTQYDFPFVLPKCIAPELVFVPFPGFASRLDLYYVTQKM